MKASTVLTHVKRSGMFYAVKPALSLMLGVAAASAMAQSPQTVRATDPSERLCTAGFNNTFGWFEDSGAFGAKDAAGLASNDCVSVTSAELDVRLGETVYPLADGVRYDFSGTNSTVVMSLLEPAICEDYYLKSTPARQTGEAAWNLVINDANGEDADASGAVNAADISAAMIPWVRGVASLNYATANGSITPNFVSAYGTTPWLRCHSGLAVNPVLPPDPVTTDPEDPEVRDLPFADGFESPQGPALGSDLQVAFFDMFDQPLSAVVTQGATTDVQFKVRVKNFGGSPAYDVRLREFLPQTPSALMPSVSRLDCVDNDNDNAACLSTGGNSNGIGANRFRQNLGTLQPGESRTFTLKRKSSNISNFDDAQAMALVQFAAFSDPSNGLDNNYSDNSRAFRIKAVEQITINRVINTNGSVGNTGGSVVRTFAPVGCAAESGTSTICPPDASGLVYQATAAAGFTFTGFTGCAGTTTALTETSGVFTTTTPASCNLVASFRSMPTVTASVSGANGTITPASQVIHYGANAFVDVTPVTGYTVNEVSGCGGMTYVSGTTWQASNVTATCAITASFAPETYTVTAIAGANGSITSSNPITLTYPTVQAVFLAAANPTYRAVLGSGTTCTEVSGPISTFGNNYMVSAENVSADCVVDLQFELMTYPVTVASLSNGSIVLDSASVVHGQMASFTVTPNVGYHLVGPVTGTSACGTITMTGNTGTAGPITAAGCELSATFAINQYSVNVSMSGGNGTIGEVGGPQGTGALAMTIDHGGVAQFQVVPAVGRYAEVTGCGFTLTSANTFTSATITADCSASVIFPLNKYLVTASVVGGNGTISPSAEMYTHGTNAAFSLTPDSGYEVDTVTDTCGPANSSIGSVLSSFYVVSPVTAACAITASFKPL